MDPVSSALTLLGAAISVTKAIRRVKNAGKQSREMVNVLAEVEALQHTLEDCEGKISTRAFGEADFCQLRIATYSREAKENLDDLALLLNKYGAEDVSVRNPKALFAAAIYGERRLNKCRDKMQQIRERLASSTVLLMSPRLDVIHGNVNEIKALLLQTSSASNAAGEANVLPADNMTRKTPGAPATVSNQPNSLDLSKITADRFGKYCVPWCSCCCHTTNSINSPRLLRRTFGAIYFASSGLPYLTKTCNQKQCARKVSPRVDLFYEFPPYVLQRRLQVSCSFDALAGPELRVKLPRVVGWQSPIWVQATAGNVIEVEGLFRNGLASPWDVNVVGGTLLHYATDTWNADLCRLLLEAGLNPEDEDDGKCSPVCMAWEHVLSGRLSSDDASVVASMFRNTNYLSTRLFTVIHKVVLGLISKDLEYELSSSTEQIDSRDSRGRTPLSWAVARGEENATRTLLKYGADPNLADVSGNTPFHHVRNVACAQLLLDFAANAHALNLEGQTPLYRTCHSIKSESLTKFLIGATGCNVNQADYSQQTPLHVATSRGKHLPFIDVLLEAGADINARNSDNDSPLRFVIFYNLHALLRKMLANCMEARFDLVNRYGQTFAHAIARSADLETVRILTDAKPATLRADLERRDVSGKTSLDYVNDRLAVRQSEDCAALKEAFEGLNRALEDRRDGSSLGDMSARGHDLHPRKIRSWAGVSHDVQGDASDHETFYDVAEYIESV